MNIIIRPIKENEIPLLTDFLIFYMKQFFLQILTKFHPEQ